MKQGAPPKTLMIAPTKPTRDRGNTQQDQQSLLRIRGTAFESLLAHSRCRALHGHSRLFRRAAQGQGQAGGGRKPPDLSPPEGDLRVLTDGLLISLHRPRLQRLRRQHQHVPAPAPKPVRQETSLSNSQQQAAPGAPPPAPTPVLNPVSLLQVAYVPGAQGYKRCARQQSA